MEMQAASVLLGYLGKDRRSHSSKLPSYETTIPPVHHHSSTESVVCSCCLPGEIIMFTWIKTVTKSAPRSSPLGDPVQKQMESSTTGLLRRTMDLRLENRSPLACLLLPGGHHHQQCVGHKCLCIELLTNGGIQPPHTGILNE